MQNRFLTMLMYMHLPGGCIFVLFSCFIFHVWGLCLNMLVCFSVNFKWPPWLDLFPLCWNIMRQRQWKRNCHLTKFPDTHMCLHNDQCCRQTTAPKCLWLFPDRGCYMLSCRFFSEVIYLFVSPLDFLLCSCVCLLIGVVIITSRILPQAILCALMPHTEPLFFH